MKMAVLWILAILLLRLTQAIVQASSTAKPGCENYCGNIEIPYPFGIGANCSLGDWFSIDCNSSTTPPKPFLSKIQSEVTEISVLGTITLNLPLTSSCSNGGRAPHESANLNGSSFVFSQMYNIFTGVGCNNLALMASNDTTIGGCLSLCHNETISNGRFTCNGIDCCQTTIPSDLKVFDVKLTRIQDGEEGGDCKYGFLVDQKWFVSNITRLSNLNNLVFLPVVLEWRISNSMFDLLEITMAENTSNVCGSDLGNSTSFSDTTSVVGCSSVCGSDLGSSTSFSDTTSVVGCSCKDGYDGNPYLPNGCQDIDECTVSSKSPCVTEDMVCQNSQGGYFCFISPVYPPITTLRFGSVVVVAAGVLILLFASWGVYKVVKKRKKAKRKNKFFKKNGGLLLKQQLMKGEVNSEKTKVFNSKELEKATDRFNSNRILGQGGQGTVYKGMLADGKIVAVKKSKIADEGKIEEFINEVVILSEINHRNIVKLMGCCLETEVPLLVYEFIPNGTLSSYLHEQVEELPLNWDMRMRIATEIAGAIFYLHSAASLPIFHRDIKSSNILLDEKFRAKIADFGTSRSVAIDQTHLTTQVQGTFGYLDPEFFQSSQFTEKSDVYSFGVVLAELLTGEAAISQKRSTEGKSLAFYFIDSMEGNNVLDIIDGGVIKEGDREDIIKVANLAKRCLNLNGRARPTMKEVVMVLESVRVAQTASGTENISEIYEFGRTEETENWEDSSMSTRSYLKSDSLTLLDH